MAMEAEGHLLAQFSQSGIRQYMWHNNWRPAVNSTDAIRHHTLMTRCKKVYKETNAHRIHKFTSIKKTLHRNTFRIHYAKNEERKSEEMSYVHIAAVVVAVYFT